MYKFFILLISVYNHIYTSEYNNNVAYKPLIELVSESLQKELLAQKRCEDYKDMLKSICRNLIFTVPHDVFIQSVLSLDHSLFDEDFFYYVIDNLHRDFDHAYQSMIFLYARAHKSIKRVVVLSYIRRAVRENSQEVQKKLYKNFIQIPLDMSCFTTENEALIVQLFSHNVHIYILLQDIRSLIGKN